jgi:hypothetical protein
MPTVVMTTVEIWAALNKHGIERPEKQSEGFKTAGPWVFEDENHRVNITGRSKLDACEIALTSEKFSYLRAEDRIVIRGKKS